MDKNLDIEKVLTASKNLNMEYIDNLATNNLNESKFKETMLQKYESLFKNFEPIFNISISKSYDYNRLNFMLNMAKKVQNDEITEHNASIEVGQVLVDQIVKPQLDKAGVKPDKK
tara:strand:- start:589 stop:933 length:345 start_codon:yes stop_codon:yes gene_type:complete